jgi:hypothetical protein
MSATVTGSPPWWVTVMIPPLNPSCVSRLAFACATCGAGYRSPEAVPRKATATVPARTTVTATSKTTPITGETARAVPVVLEG